MIVKQEADLSDLIPGDRVEVMISDKRMWMTYQGVYEDTKRSNQHDDTTQSIPKDRKYKARQLDQYSRVSFIQEVSPNHEHSSLIVWTSSLKHLQFGQEGIVYTDHRHRHFTPVKPDAPTYQALKTLVDMVQ